MTTPLDLEIPPEVTQVLDEFGATATLRQFLSGAYVASTGTYTEGSGTDTEVKIIPPWPVDEKLVDGDNYHSEDMMTGLTGESTVVPAIDDSIILTSVEYKIIGRKKVRSGDDIALYMLHIRELKG